MKRNIPSARISQLISKEFSATITKFDVYSDYCNMYCNSFHLLQTLLSEREGLSDYLSLLAKDPRSQGQDLFSYLIKPIQVMNEVREVMNSVFAGTPCSLTGCYPSLKRIIPIVRQLKY